VTTIEVRTEPTSSGWRCSVHLVGEQSASDHTISVTQADLDRLDPGASDPTDLVRRSFEFLLEREPKESILRTFDLPVIGRYFPDYERTIKPRV
jgi:hypothetical protein